MNDFKALEKEAQQRKERIEKWRKEMEKDEEQNAMKAEADQTVAWTLDDDADDDEVENQIMKTSSEVEINTTQEIESEEVDPLDQFMAGVTAEVRSLLKSSVKKPKEVKSNAQKSASSNGNASVTAVDVDEEAELKEAENPTAEEDDFDLNDPANLLSLAMKKAKKKDIIAVDHETVKYMPFRKNFYQETQEIAKMTHEQIDASRKELDGIKVRGKNPPKPITKWAQCGLHVKIMDILLRKCKYDKPTPIQCQAIPAIMSGRDVIAVAKTGSGKTMAFLLPMFRHILDQPPLSITDGPISLIMTPTRELAVQIYLECRKFAKALNLRVICAYGGSPIKDNIADLKRGAEILVCTPGRIIDLLAANSGRVTNLRRVTYIVLDEADRMFDMGFEPQVTKIIKNVRPDRQTVLFSATFPKQMESLARSILKYQPVEIIVGGKSVVCSDVEQVVTVFDEASVGTTQDTEDEAKFLKLLQILGQWYEVKTKRILIFVDRQDSADRLLRDIMRRGYPCLSLHGGKDQSDRDSTLADFKAGVVSILIATSVASRGLDVKDLDLVINYDCPNHYEDYVHRVGRTGRAGRKGTAITFITPAQEKFAPDIAKALKASGVELPPDLVALSEGFLEKVKQGGVTATGRGFGGRGLEKMEREREILKKTQKLAYNQEDVESSDDEELVEVDGELQVVSKKKSELEIEIDKRLNDSIKSSTKVTSETTAIEQHVEPETPTEIPVVEAESGKKETGQAVAGEIHLNELAMAVKSKEIISMISARIKEQLQATVGTAPEDKAGTAAASAATETDETKPGAVSCEIEINDYPQYARWKVTNRDSVNSIYDVSRAAITVRGTYLNPNSRVTVTDPSVRKLHLFVEAESEMALERAKSEIKRIIKEATFEAASRGLLDPVGRGKYTI